MQGFNDACMSGINNTIPALHNDMLEQYTAPSCSCFLFLLEFILYAQFLTLIVKWNIAAPVFFPSQFLVLAVKYSGRYSLCMYRAGSG